jgi:hypothetical protein
MMAAPAGSDAERKMPLRARFLVLVRRRIGARRRRLLLVGCCCALALDLRAFHAPRQQVSENGFSRSVSGVVFL